LRHLSERRRVIVVSGITGSARGLLVALIQHVSQRRVAFLTPTPEDVEIIEADVRHFMRLVAALAPGDDDGVTVFPVVEGGPYSATPPHPNVLEARALCLSKMAEGDGRAFLLPARALLERLPSRKTLDISSLTLKAGEEYPLDDLIAMLADVGYLRREPVSEIGEFSQRGGIVDFYSPAHERPIRLEFFGDTLESIREFDVDTQRSTANRAACQILPMREITASRHDLTEWAHKARARWTDERFEAELRPRLEAAERGELFHGWEYLLPLSNPLAGSMFDYLGDMLLVVDEPAAIEQILENYAKQLHNRFSAAHDGGELVLPPEYFLHSATDLRTTLERRPRVELRVLGVQAATVDTSFVGDVALPVSESAAELLAGATAQPFFLFPIDSRQPEIHLSTQAGRKYHGRIPQLVTALRESRQKGVTTLMVMPSLGVAERVADMLKEYDIHPALHPDPPSLLQSESLTRAGCLITVGTVVNGFQFSAAGLNVIVEREIFDEAASPEEMRLTPPGKTSRRKSSISSFLSDFRDLKIGDYIVHVDHGIGKFLGLQQVQLDPRDPVREFMILAYADGQRLSVPVERLDLVQKYSSAEGAHTPQLDKLGGIGWAKTKARVKRAMRDMAEELLKLYAERRLVQGSQCSPDGPWQREFEDAFPYELTPDQSAAVADIKTDLEAVMPMDRLLCGDVGFGKTEVAMRAAFKVAMDAKQVAVLTPTTVLSFQHWKTFRERFASFPIVIEMVSRFRTPKEIKETLARLERGEVDILIGTHRILSKDVSFKNLGLVIVDEEQRFGVAHKEKLKQLRRKVDVLTLSATPIPRTLNLSLAGLRDMSVIETPPRDRLAIHTVVAQFSEAVVKSAVETELARGGQAFFVHNRVESIYTIADLLRRLIPNARIGVGHGQMGEKELESVMMKFVHHELDILVSTTIIENGIDIPLANTIIINHAEHYGLAQLYQLRGRVGRSSRRAYAYLLIPPETQLSAVARQRLAAIREFSDLGSGFRIAALDLELRGAGNMLGGEQSGHLDSVGFDLYCQMLDHTVKELRGTVIEEEVGASVNLKLDIRLPEEYIGDVGQRLRTYKRISSAPDDAALDALGRELDDRYGPRPAQVNALFEYARLRREASPMGVLSIDYENGVLLLKCAERAKIDMEKLMKLVTSTPGASFSPSRLLKIPLAAPTNEALFLGIHRVFNELRA
jgi:transcription-repair coupling factor (superfamily II helicase)